MRSLLLLAAAIAGLFAHSAAAQARPTDPPGVRLELTMDVATTTEDGLPEALQFTLTNVGSVAVAIPAPAIDCNETSGSIRIEVQVHFDGPKGKGTGHGCGSEVSGRGLPFVERVRREWLHLRPGEHLIFFGDRRRIIDKAGAPATYEFRAVYMPPALSPEQRALAAQNGIAVPAEDVESDSIQYHDEQ